MKSATRELASFMKTWSSFRAKTRTFTLQTWYVGVRSAQATDGWLNRALLVPQRVVGYRPTSRFFHAAIGIRSFLTVGPHQKARSRPVSAYQPCRRHVGGNECPLQDEGRADDERTLSCGTTGTCQERILRLKEKARGGFLGFADSGVKRYPSN